MRLEQLMAPPAAEPDEPQTAVIEVEGEPVEIRYRPMLEGSEDLTESELLNRHLVGWDVTDALDQPVPLNADVIGALAPEVKAAFCAAILGDEAEAEDEPAPTDQSPRRRGGSPPGS